MSDGSDSINKFAERGELIRQQQTAYRGNVALAKVTSDLDSTLNFRVNSALKLEFDKLCKENHSTVARELKRYMTSAIAQSKLI
ncbi:MULTISPECIES: hypothetical protein [Pseudomonas syringae group]|uniref:Uncharacterized protein n=1 Tax=Pseudomonas amygdali pv. lachrymans str. M301315 TaxID=629260 RepID=A0AAD0LZN5_PSEAV|nr:MULTISPECIES: hypothetical protein [Pseudomonas syringae group]AXH56417.1 hypothetical protein PLA107_014695 [Pseudomonas amygdali pv. lachrymans str. M301315]MDG6385641.1 hypothetical protein [Pseudomonas syringae]MDU8489671.1 hypothetical protein [Pseudomonas syringae pv. actinidiae]NVL22000.1 hypothetical protein [Pseudomonas syringae pv. actinidiae]NVL27136.1 hypothetical protein [Pseudomonas syringae pv. actinidiae]